MQGACVVIRTSDAGIVQDKKNENQPAVSLWNRSRGRVQKGWCRGEWMDGRMEEGMNGGMGEWMSEWIGGRSECLGVGRMNG